MLQQRPKKQVTFARRGAGWYHPVSPTTLHSNATPSSPSTPPRLCRHPASPRAPYQVNDDEKGAAMYTRLDTQKADWQESNSQPASLITTLPGDEGRSVTASQSESLTSQSPTSPPLLGKKSASMRRPRDFPVEFAIQPKIEKFEKKDILSLDEETLKRFDVATRPVRKLHRAQTLLPAGLPADPDDWWGTQSAPSDGSNAEVACEYFAIGTPPGGRSRASSVCSLGSIYSRSSRSSSRSSRSMKSVRSAISQSSLYYCSSHGSQNSLYSSNGSLYAA